MYLILAAIVLVLIVGFVLVRSNTREERLTRDLGTELGALAEQLKLELLVLDEEEQRTAIDQLLPGSRLHRRAASGEAGFNRVMCGPLDGYQVTLFDYRDTESGSNAFTVLVVRPPAAGLPRFQLQPTGADNGVPPAAVTGLQRLEPADSTLFNESFQLEVHEEDRERLAALLRGPAIGFFEARLDARLLVESLGDRLLIYEMGRVLPAARAEKLLHRSTELADALTGRVRPAPDPPPEPERTPNPPS